MHELAKPALFTLVCYPTNWLLCEPDGTSKHRDWEGTLVLVAGWKLPVCMLAQVSRCCVLRRGQKRALIDHKGLCNCKAFYPVTGLNCLGAASLPSDDTRAPLERYAQAWTTTSRSSLRAGLYQHDCVLLLLSYALIGEGQRATFIISKINYNYEPINNNNNQKCHLYRLKVIHSATFITMDVTIQSTYPVIIYDTKVLTKIPFTVF